MLMAFALSACAAQPAQQQAAIIPPAADALAALEGILAAYAEGQTLHVETKVEPAMIGYQQWIDAMRLSHAQQKQIRIALHDTQVVNGSDTVTIRSAWDKRYLSLPELSPVLRKGQSVFLMQLTQDGWKLAAQSGDNLFAP